MIRRTKENLKWSVIVIGTIVTLASVFSGDINVSIPLIPLFWIYVILDKTSTNP